MNRFGYMVGLALTLGLSTGCATLTGTKVETLTVNSVPEGAEVKVDGALQGRTPVRVELDKAKPPVVEVSMPGYSTHKCSTRMSPATSYIVADVAMCLLIPVWPFGCISFIDAMGPWNELDQPTCNATLQPAVAGQGAFVPVYPANAPAYPQQPAPQGYPQQPAPQGYQQPGYPPQPAYPAPAAQPQQPAYPAQQPMGQPQ